MAIANEYDASSIKISESENIVYIVGLDSFKGIFRYDIYCRGLIVPGLYYGSKRCAMFFNLEKSKMLLVVQHSGEYPFKCVVMGFSVRDDAPVADVNWCVNMTEVMSRIADDFKHKYSSILIDRIINE